MPVTGANASATLVPSFSGFPLGVSSALGNAMVAANALQTLKTGQLLQVAADPSAFSEEGQDVVLIPCHYGKLTPLRTLSSGEASEFALVARTTVDLFLEKEGARRPFQSVGLSDSLERYVGALQTSPSENSVLEAERVRFTQRCRDVFSAKLGVMNGGISTEIPSGQEHVNLRELVEMHKAFQPGTLKALFGNGLLERGAAETFSASMVRYLEGTKDKCDSLYSKGWEGIMGASILASVPGLFLMLLTALGNLEHETGIGTDFYLDQPVSLGFYVFKYLLMVAPYIALPIGTAAYVSQSTRKKMEGLGDDIEPQVFRDNIRDLGRAYNALAFEAHWH